MHDASAAGAAFTAVRKPAAPPPPRHPAAMAAAACLPPARLLIAPCHNARNGQAGEYTDGHGARRYRWGTTATLEPRLPWCYCGRDNDTSRHLAAGLPSGPARL